MAKKKKGTEPKVKKVKRLSDADLAELGALYDLASKRAAKYAKEKSAAQAAVVEELQIRGTKSIEHDNVRVTMVQQENVVYNPDTLYADLSPKQRRLVYNENVDLNALSAKTRKKVLAALSKEERQAVTTWTLDLDALSSAVQNDQIDATLVADHAEVKKSAPYIRVTFGSPS